MLSRKHAVELGIHPSTLYRLRDEHALSEISRGLFRLTEMGDLSEEPLVAVSKKAPQGVICLISALAFHGITTQIPHQVFVALPRDIKAPKIKSPSLRVFHYSEPSYVAGIETHLLDGVQVKIYSPEKTVVDCFKFRNKIGLDVALEALKLCIEKYKSRPAQFMELARICRVARIMKPYLEVL